MKKLTCLVLTILAVNFNTKAQDGFEGILLADPTDTNTLMEAYFAPAMEGFIYSMSNGWYHTAKVHNKLGFDLSLGLNASQVPSEREVFNIAALGLVSVTSNSTEASTFAGPDNATTFTATRTFTFTDPNTGQSRTEQFSANFETPAGVSLPLNAVPAPLAQLTVGLPVFDTDVMVRFVPETNVGDAGSTKLFGIGLKKEITSWFGPLDKLPLHVSLLAAYTTMDVSYGIDDVDFPTDQTQAGIEVKNALAAFDLSSYTVQAVASLNFPIISVFGGFGYSRGESNLRMDGTYRGRFSYTEPVTNRTFTETVNLAAPDLSFNASGIRTTLGARLSLGFFKIFGSYTIQEFNTISAGIAIGIR